MGTMLSIVEVMKLIAGRSGKSIAKLSKELGFNSRASLSAMILRGTMQPDLMQTYANKCGYKIIFVPIDQDVPNELCYEGRVSEVEGEVDE